jgi:hypothetical protein
MVDSREKSRLPVNCPEPDWLGTTPNVRLTRDTRSGDAYGVELSILIALSAGTPFLVPMKWSRLSALAAWLWYIARMILG